MKVASILLIAILAAAISAEKPPKVEGNVSAVSGDDIQFIVAAAQSWLQNMHTQNPKEKIVDKLLLIHVLDREKAEVNVKQDSAKGWSATMIITVRRSGTTWKADSIARAAGLKIS